MKITEMAIKCNQMITNLLSAVSFLTIIPVRKQELQPGAILYFPAVGLFLGGMSLLIFTVSLLVFPVNVAIFITLVCYIIISGGFHLDGFSDTIDGISGGRGNKERILNIMADSHIGSHGVIALVCLLGLKYLLLLAISQNIILKTFILMPVVGRWSMVIAMRYSMPAKEEGLGKLFIEYSKKNNILLPCIFVLLLSGLLFQLQGILIVTGLFMATILLKIYFAEKGGGMTGDTIGAVNEIVEVLFLAFVYVSFVG